MTTHRFEVTDVPEHQRISFHPSEIFPLIPAENNIPSHLSVTSVNETNKSSTRLFNSFLQRLKLHSSAADIIPKGDTAPASALLPHSASITNLTVDDAMATSDTYQSTAHSNALDTNSLRLTDKFLHELRSKRREFHEKANHLPIDQRIALNRQHYDREIMRAQDIFAIHFELNDNDNLQTNIFNEDAQEKIRHNIFNELDRQRTKQYNKQCRQLIVGRALLMFMTAFFVFMGMTLIYVVMDFYARANYSDLRLPENTFVSMVNDKSTDFQL